MGDTDTDKVIRKSMLLLVGFAFSLLTLALGVVFLFGKHIFLATVCLIVGFILFVFLFAKIGTLVAMGITFAPSKKQIERASFYSTDEDVNVPSKKNKKSTNTQFEPDKTNIIDMIDHPNLQDDSSKK